MKRRAALALMLVAIGCTQTPARPATRYDVWNYSVSVPDDLAVKPWTTDPYLIWTAGLSLPSTGGASGGSLAIRVQEQTQLGSESDTAMQLLTTAMKRAEPDSVSEVTQKSFAAGPGALVHATEQDLVLDVAYLYHEGQLVTFVGTGMTPADIELIAGSFTFRDPPGDPGSPPSRAPTASP